MNRSKSCVACVLSMLMLLFSGCGRQGEPAKPAPGSSAASGEDRPAYTAPEISEAVFHEDLATGESGVLIDVSATAEGYVAVSAQSDNRLKFLVVKGEDEYRYDLPSDGTETIFGLQSGDGTYLFRVMENVVDTKYAELFSMEADVELLDEFQPFLRTNQYVDYHSGSSCVKKAKELASGTHSQLEAANAIFTYICENVTYDAEKAKTVPKGYIPSPDDTLAQGTGICFDYASLAASMLRSQGIPTKLITGYVAPNDLYHAWNMFYTEESGWITVGYEVSGGNWNRIDCTFTANGADPETVGDGTNYTELYVY